MRAHKISEKARRPIRQRVVALVAAGSLVSACTPMMPPPYPSAGYAPGPYQPRWSGGYRMAPPPYAYRQPVPAGGYPFPVPQQQQATGSNIENDALFGGAGYLVGRQFSGNAADSVAATAAELGEAAAARGGAAVATDETVAAGVGAAETAVVARTVTVTAGRAAVAGAAELGAAEIGAGAVAAEGGEVAAAAAVGEFLVPAILIGGAAYLAYRALSDSSQHDR